jgi:hypothetical protein
MQSVENQLRDELDNFETYRHLWAADCIALRFVCRLQTRRAASLRKEINAAKYRFHWKQAGNRVIQQNRETTLTVELAATQQELASFQSNAAYVPSSLPFSSTQLQYFLTGALISSEVTSRILHQDDRYRPMTWIGKKVGRGVKQTFFPGTGKTSPSKDCAVLLPPEKTLRTTKIIGVDPAPILFINPPTFFL